MSYLEKLKAAETLHDVARLLGFAPKNLAYILYKRKNKYTKFTIPKSSGGVREVSAPYPPLMNLQKRLSDLLQDCLAEINKERNISTALSHGFRRKCSIITNASNHRNKRYVFNTDINDFFGTFNFGRVRGFFIKNNNFNLEPKVATVLAQIACNDNSLPQGSPCSPVISNLISHSLDIKLAKLAYNYGCHYSRYADDLTFSTNLRAFPSEIAKTIPVHDHMWKTGDELEKIINKSGFTVNSTKTRMQYRNSRQDVTGIVVNKKVNIRKEYWRSARAMANSLFKFGEFTINKLVTDQNGNKKIDKKEGAIEQLNGILSFIDTVDLYNANKSKEKDGTKTRLYLNSRQKVYNEFLFFKHFYSAIKPTIICEGKTDNIYIKSAIKSLHKKFKELGEIEENKIKYKVNFFNYSKVTGRVMGLSGGTSCLASLIGTYPKSCKRYSAEISNNPVIILIDNDSGSAPVFSSAKKLTEKDVDGSDDFYHLCHNLYLVVIPKINDKETKIEDYFENKILSIKLNGKTFNSGNDFDRGKEYGKHLFAEKVIKNNQKKIDFSKFEIILNRIELAINDYNR